MKQLLLLLAALGLSALPLAAQSDLVARIHFLGGQRISTDANSRAFYDEFCSPEARALEKQTLDKMAGVPHAWFGSKLPAGAVTGNAQLRPLLDDLLTSEWIFEIRDAPGSPEYALAIRLNNDRAALWSKNLQTLLQNWTRLGVSMNKGGGWSLKKHLPPNLIQVSRWNDWLIVDCGENQLKLYQEMTASLSKPVSADWLDLDLNWPRLAQLYPALARFDFPRIQMYVTGRDGNLEINGKLNLSQPLPALAAWKLPQTIIHEPFNSFTAVRGITPWLERQSWAQRYRIPSPPNQFFIWSLPMMPFQTFAAAPVPNADSALNQLYARLPVPQNSAPTPGVFVLTPQLANHEITWHGIPGFASPFIQALREKSGEYLYAGLFPNIPKSPPLPRELLSALSEPNLVYYHWEVTTNRAPQVLNITQFGLMIARDRQLDGNSPAAKWVSHIEPHLGTSVTTATEASPTQVDFKRRARVGLTAVELYALANWLEAPNFPGCDLNLPPRPNLPHRPLIHGHTPVPTSGPVFPVHTK